MTFGSHTSIGPALVQPVYGADGTTDDVYLDDLSTTKTFLDWLAFVPTLRMDMKRDPVGTLSTMKLSVDADKMRPLWDDDDPTGGAERPPAVAQHEARLAERLWRRRLARRTATMVTDPVFSAWRRRQLARLHNDLGPHHSERQALHPVAFELQSGCSVGCWFCGFSAPALTRLWRYDDRTGRFWRDVLNLFQDRLGPSAAHGFCYWASDPLDNPDYERFAEDFRAVLGRYPQMTTAIPLRDPVRTGRILDAAWASEREVHRFSVLGVGQFRRIMETFTARQLLLVDLVPMHGRGMAGKAAAGRARNREPLPPAPDMALGGQLTIACLAGFLLNMAEGTIKLVVPCRPDDHRPDGVRILAEDVFGDLPSLDAAVDRMIREAMPMHPPGNRPVRLLNTVTAHAESGGVVLVSPWQRTVFLPDDEVAKSAGPAGLLARLLTEGRHGPEKLTAMLADSTDMPAEAVDRWLGRIFAAGFLDEYVD